MRTHEDPGDGLPLVQRPAVDHSNRDEEVEPVSAEELKARQEVKFRKFLVQDRARRIRCIG